MGRKRRSSRGDWSGPILRARLVLDYRAIASRSRIFGCARREGFLHPQNSAHLAPLLLLSCAVSDPRPSRAPRRSAPRRVPGDVSILARQLDVRSPRLSRVLGGSVVERFDGGAVLSCLAA